MDPSTFIGILVAVLAILLGQHLEGGNILMLLNVPALIIVLGGTIGAVMVETPFSIIKRAFGLSKQVFFPVKIDMQRRINKFVVWGNIARNNGYLGLEQAMSGEKDLFCKKALQMLIDGASPEMMRTILESDIIQKEYKDTLASKVFESMGGYSPTIGIIGAVLGLIQVMGNLSDPSKLGAGIAVAFVATIYGVGFANLIFIPISNKLNKIIMQKSKMYEMVIEGVISIANSDSPRTIAFKLDGYK